MTDPLKPHVLNNLEHRARHDMDHGHPSVHTRLPSRMLMALIEEVRASRAKAACTCGRAPGRRHYYDCPLCPDPPSPEPKGRSRVVFVPSIADVEAPTLSELAAGTPVEGIEEVALTKRDVFRHLYSGTRPDEEALWQRFRDEGGKIVNEHGEVIATVGPAVPSPDDPYGFVAPLTPPSEEPAKCSDCGGAHPPLEPIRPMHVVYDDLGAGQPCSCHHDANHVRGMAPELTPEKQGQRTSWVEFDETHDFSKMTEEIRADVAKLAGITATPPTLVEHEHDWRMQGRWECVSPGCDRRLD